MHLFQNCAVKTMSALSGKLVTKLQYDQQLAISSICAEKGKREPTIPCIEPYKDVVPVWSWAVIMAGWHIGSVAGIAWEVD